jgi:hypothetical protein
MKINVGTKSNHIGQKEEPWIINSSDKSLTPPRVQIRGGYVNKGCELKNSIKKNEHSVKGVRDTSGSVEI